MKNLIYLLLLSLIIGLAACSSKNKNTTDETTMALTDSMDVNGVQCMQEFKNESDIVFKGKKYHSVISRTVDKEMPHISNDMGEVYADNKIELRLARGDEQIFCKTLTKNDFASLVDADFMSKSILEAIVFDKTTPDGIMFAVSISYPQTDLYVPLSITIAPDGKMQLGKAELLEDEYSDEASE